MSKPNRKTQRRPTPAAGDSSGTRRVESGTASGGGEFKPNYAYVVKDLRRIALLAGGLIVGLIILSFFLK